jgi:hypothetical protein
MMSDQTARRLLQLGCLMIAESVFYAFVPVPAWGRVLIGIALGLALIRHWSRVANPKPKHSRKRLGPPLEWIDR